MHEKSTINIHLIKVACELVQAKNQTQIGPMVGCYSMANSLPF